MVWTSLHKAAMLGNVEKITEDLQSNKDAVHQLDKHSRTPLHLAAEYDQPEAINFLIKNGAEIEKEVPGGLTSLHIATSLGLKKAVAELISLKADVNKMDDDGYSPLHMAAKLGNIDLVSLLLMYESDVSLLNQDNMTPLCVAVYHRNEEVALLLDEIDDNGASDECLARMPKDIEGIDEILLSFIGDNSTNTEFNILIYQDS